MKMLDPFRFVSFRSICLLLIFLTALAGNIICSSAKDLSDNSSYVAGTAMIRLKSGADHAFMDRLQMQTSLTMQSRLLSESNKIDNNSALLASALPEKINAIRLAEEPLLRTYRINFDKSLNVMEFCRKLTEQYPEIEIAEPVLKMKVQFTPNDPKVSLQTMLAKIKAFQAWDICSGDTNVIIGISDNGVEQTHEDLKPQIAINYNDPVNGKDDDGNGYIDDYNGYNFSYVEDSKAANNTYNPSGDHGTNVAGIAAAAWNNGLGIAGVAGKCRLYPIKSATDNAGEDVVYGYESIVFAAVHRFKVLNCSWGTDSGFYSYLSQSVIDYAVACDVAIVAAAGNTGYSVTPYYPANYYGVLGVGEVDSQDVITNSTSFGEHAKIFAQGVGNWLTSANNTYSAGSPGTSYASPVVAGVVAVVRSKYPNLTAIQALELVRQCTDDITEQNPDWKDILPGRVNMLKAVSTDPYSIAAIKPNGYTYKNSKNEVSDRFSPGDEVLLSVNAHNFLGDANNVRFVISTVQDDDNTVQLETTEVKIASVPSKCDLSIEPFKFKILKANKYRLFFRVDVYADNNYHDFFLLPYTAISQVALFSNQYIKFSMSDRGTIGFGGIKGNKEGIGFSYKDIGNQLWKSAMIITADNTKYTTSYNWSLDTSDDNDFRWDKQFTPPDRNINIFNDTSSINSRIIGVRVKQELIVPQDMSIARINFTLTNISGEDINSLAMGYYFDWDVGGSDNSDFNYVRLFSEAIPEGFKNSACTAEIETYKSDYPVFGAAVYSTNPNAKPQAAGLNKNDSFDSEQLFVDVLNSGLTIQRSGISDCKYVIGMKFPGPLAQDSSLSFSMVFGGADTEKDLSAQIGKLLFGITDVADEKNINMQLYPNPASDKLILMLPEEINSVSVYNSEGSKVNAKIRIENQTAIIDVADFVSGCYYLMVHCRDKQYRSKAVIQK